MTTTEYLCRQFSRMGARLKIQEPHARQSAKVRIDVGRDRNGEFFDIRLGDGAVPEILDVQSAARHLVLMVRDGGDKNKFLLGRDERHWFAAAAPGAVSTMYGPQWRVFGPRRLKADRRSGRVSGSSSARLSSSKTME